MLFLLSKSLGSLKGRRPIFVRRHFRETLIANELEEMLSDVWQGRHVYCLAVSVTWSDRWYLSLAREINELTLILATFVHWGGGVACSKLICVSDRAVFEQNIWSSCHAGHVCCAISALGGEGHLCLSVSVHAHTRWLGLCHPACLFCKGASGQELCLSVS